MSLAANALAGSALSECTDAAPAKSGGPKPRLMVALADPKIVPERR